MARITDYDTLKTAVAEWLNRADLTAQIPQFIQFAEADFNTRLRCNEQIIRARATSNNQYVKLPVDWIEAVNLQIVGGVSPLRFMTLDQADQFNYAITQGEMSPQGVVAYSIMDGQIELIPAPGTDVDIEMVYYGALPALGQPGYTSAEITTTNWLLQKSPDVYLYGALAHAQPFLIDDARMPTFLQILAGRIEALNLTADRARHSGSPLVARTRRI